MLAIAELLAGPRGRVLAICWLAWVVDFHDLVLFAFSKPAIAAELRLTMRELAWIDGWTLAASAAGGLLFGRLADRHSRRLALLLGLAVCSAGAAATALAGDYASLLAARIVTGLGVGSGWGIGHALIAEVFPAHLRLRAAALLQAGGPAAMALAATTGCLLAPEIGWRPTFALALLPVLALPFAWRVLPGRAPDQPAAAPVAALFRPPYRRAGLVLLGVLTLHMAGFWSTYAWLPSLLLQEANASPSFVWTFQVSANLVHVFADVAFGQLATRFGRRRMFVLFCAAFAAGLLVVALAGARLLAEPAAFAAAVALVGFGAGSWSAFGPWFAAHHPAPLRATAASASYNLARGAQLVTMPLLGSLFAMTGTLAVGLWVGAACAAASALLSLALPRPLTHPVDPADSAADRYWTGPASIRSADDGSDRGD